MRTTIIIAVLLVGCKLSPQQASVNTAKVAEIRPPSGTSMPSSGSEESAVLPELHRNKRGHRTLVFIVSRCKTRFSA